MNEKLNLEKLTEEELLSLYDEINKHLDYLSNSILTIEEETVTEDGGDENDG